MRRRTILVGLAALVAVLALLAGVRLYPSSAPGIGFASPDGELACTVRASCDPGEVEVFRMSSLANGHAQTADTHPTTYPYTVCCQHSPYLTTECTGDYASALTLSAEDNAHAASDESYPTEVCLSAPNTVTDCQAGPTCDADYACLATISDTTNAHVADCDGTLDYDTKVCCLAACIDRLGDTQCDDPFNDPDDDGCTDAEEAALGSVFDPSAWYDVYDVPVPAKPDADGANGARDGAIDIRDVLAVLLYAFTEDNGDPNANGVDYDSVKGVDLDGDSVNDASPLQDIEEGLKYDRSPGPDPDPVTGIDPAGPPDGAVDIGDVLATLAQAFEVDCSGP